MARLNTGASIRKHSGDDSDSGSNSLPELDDVLFTTTRTAAKSRGVTCKKGSKDKSETISSYTARRTSAGSESESVKSEAEDEKREVTKSVVRKKRILKPMTKNPLLRPLNKSGCLNNAISAATASERATLDSKREARKVSTRGVAVPKLKALAARGSEDARVMDDLVTGLGRTTLGAGAEKGRGRRPPRSATSAAAVAKYILDEADVDGGSEDEEDDEDDDGMSDFIVNDSCLLTEDESELVESPPPPPRSVRRLVKGRRPERLNSEVDDLGIDLGKLSFGLQEDDGWMRKEKETVKQVIEILDSSDEDVLAEKGPIKVKKETAPKKGTRVPEASSGIDEPLATLTFSPSPRKPRVISQGTRFTTPPPSPTKKALKSPTKKLASIPLTPHRPSTDGFWSQDVINDWNDEYSPRKELKAKPLLDDEGELSEGALLFSPKKSPVKQDKLAREAKKAFSQTKHALADSFLKELDDTITDGQISKLAASTGGVKIIWSKKLNTTAGRANWKRETIRSPALGSEAPRITYRHHAAIELAEKVIDDADRLLNVLAHEFCHLANFMISNIKTNPHGKEFKAWASKVSARFADRNIEVTTKHSYTIDYKYIWECSGCALEYKRHSKSIDPLRHQCGSCRAKLVQIKPVPKKCSSSSVDPAGRSAYQVFVKEQMKKVRAELPPGSPQKVIMGELGRRYREMKALREEGEAERSSDGTPVLDKDPVAAVVRKLDFLDLTTDA